jgi:hypothetical protein
MFVLMTLRALILLQLLAALCWPAQASAVDAPHRAMHAMLSQHEHEKSVAHHHSQDESHEHDHDNEHDDAGQLQLTLADESALVSGAAQDSSADHHHHFEASPSVALLSAQAPPALISHAVQNPSALAAMHSAELQPKLRPPIL